MLELFSDHLFFHDKPFHYFWLRDNCPCDQCQHESGQRLIEVMDVPMNIRPEAATVVDIGVDKSLQILWQDGHRSIYPASLLIAEAFVPETPSLWGGGLQTDSIRFDYNAIDDPEVKRQWLQAIETHGLSFLYNVPAQVGQVLKVVDHFGYVRETNYGRYFEVISKEEPENLAFTPRPLSLHTDNPYRHPVPTLQLLHCLEAAPEGGVTALADGFYAAQLLRQQHPEYFALLSTITLHYNFSSDSASLSSSGPVIELDCEGEIIGIRINNRSVQPVRLPFEETRDFYEAYQCFMNLLHSEACKYTCKLAPGELMMFNNQRVLHGREVPARGKRHLQGAYADIDSLRSELKRMN
ncbi:TauD/TfdA family dioxygenase [Endozoicomonas sp. 8E]|uniref:TauD/TfdA family dioxygenase n=1 Tax=Endozoicomonas sp. 8E TaxID=3035692 RepID=UPI0029394BA8|nr:TauD/TfdA family dioxygenase [Endozoicomonas sp. 8E]WOG27491.1 TauD/TfdA family dioxygenase [Endozoicomonas sp. 8E]